MRISNLSVRMNDTIVFALIGLLIQKLTYIAVPNRCAEPGLQIARRRKCGRGKSEGEEYTIVELEGFVA